MNTALAAFQYGIYMAMRWISIKRVYEFHCGCYRCCWCWIFYSNLPTIIPIESLPPSPVPGNPFQCTTIIHGPSSIDKMWSLLCLPAVCMQLACRASSSNPPVHRTVLVHAVIDTPKCSNCRRDVGFSGRPFSDGRCPCATVELRIGRGTLRGFYCPKYKMAVVRSLILFIFPKAIHMLAWSVKFGLTCLVTKYPIWHQTLISPIIRQARRFLISLTLHTTLMTTMAPDCQLTSEHLRLEITGKTLYFIFHDTQILEGQCLARC